MAVTAIVPLKALGAAKTRLAGVVDGADRRALVAWMLDRVVAACRACPEVDGVLVVAGDNDAADLGRAAGAAVLLVERPGLNHAIVVADGATRGADATLVVAADLPAVSAADLHAVVAASGSGRAVVVAATRDGGTGALLRRPGAVIAPAYGPGSARAHLNAARRAGIAAVRLDIPGLAEDVDTPQQLRRLLATAVGRDIGSAASRPTHRSAGCRRAP